MHRLYRRHCRSRNQQPIFPAPAMEELDQPQRKGSCCIASTCSMAEWTGQPELAQFFRKSYSGPQTQISIQQKLTAANVPFVCTEYADPKLLEYATRTRRMAIVWFYDRHCVTFCGFGWDQGQEVAWLLDNNRVESFIPVPKREFLYRWKYSYGGFGTCNLALTSSTTPQVKVSTMSPREFLSWFLLTFLVGVLAGYHLRSTDSTIHSSDCRFPELRIDQEAYQVPTLPPKVDTYNSKLNEAKENERFKLRPPS